MSSPDISPAVTSARIAPQPPAALLAQFGARSEPLLRYAQLLADSGIERGLIGPHELERLWDRHLLNSVAIAELLPPEVRLVDIGTGAGLPGLALACVRHDLAVDLVEPLLRRTTFLTEAVELLGLRDRVRVLRGRAEDPEIRSVAGTAEYVTARAVAGLDKLVTWSLPLLRSGGNLLAIKGQSAEVEIDRYRGAVNAAGADIVGVVECGRGLVEPVVRVVHVRRR